jgi:hypothetical protein
MLRKEGYQTKFLYSDEIYNKLIDKNSLLESINKEFDFSFINEEVKDVYCEDTPYNPLQSYSCAEDERFI